MIAFDLHGGEKEAFQFLDALKVIRLAVSLGGTESLCTHPATTSHMPLSQADRDKYGIGDAMIRFSVGIEKLEDLQHDLEQALGNR
jgi:methionine-gamma-lyase